MNPLPIDVPPDDARLEQLLDELPRCWANVPVGETGLDVAWAYVRAAYGHGYVRALEGAPA